MEKLVEEKILLTKTLTRYDRSTTVDVVDGRRSQSQAHHNHTFLLQVLLEHVCRIVEPDGSRRSRLFNEVCKHLAQSHFVDADLILNGLSEQRQHAAERFLQYVKDVHRQVLKPVALAFQPSSVEPTHQDGLKQNPRYEQLFDELEVVARGGFGIVCKARHKLDGFTYAVKKIIFKYTNDSKYSKVIREAKSIATLKHCNVVSYNHAWVEYLPDYENHFSGESSSDSPEDDSSNLCHSRVESTTESSSDSSQVTVIEKSSLDSQEEDESTDSHRESTNSEIRSRSFSSELSEVQSCLTYTAWNLTSLQVTLMLCIQMEYCDSDLRLWLDRRAKDEPLPFNLGIMNIFSDILHGIAYIHSKNIIHRDLKPQNIFYSKENSVMKIGDFGLATLTHCSSEDEACTKKGPCCFSGALGTRPYAAPEQRSGKKYDCKVDMYSLGIILFELVQMFSTRMEFSKAVDELLKGSFSAELIESWPEHVDLVKRLVQHDPIQRPSAQEVLKLPLLNEAKEKDECDRLECQRRIKRLMDTLQQKDKEIANLKMLLNTKEDHLCVCNNV